MAKGFSEVTFDHREDDLIVLKTDRGSEIRWPKDEFPDELAEGEKFVVLSKRYASQTDPKTLLNDLLQEAQEEE